MDKKIYNTTANNAIVCLTKTQATNNLDGYSDLLERNKSIYKYMNTALIYPLIIFHERDFPISHQKYIIQESFNQTVEFIDISKVWDHNKGYESMCRFFAYYVWQYCSDFDNILRIDDDCRVLACQNDPFALRKDNVFLYSIKMQETHPQTNKSLPAYIESITGKQRQDFYHSFPYTNVCLSNVQFWLDKEINNVLKSIALNEQQLINRWGDLPILGSLLNIYAKGKTQNLEGLIYLHNSHAAVVDCNFNYYCSWRNPSFFFPYKEHYPDNVDNAWFHQSPESIIIPRIKEYDEKLSYQIDNNSSPESIINTIKYYDKKLSDQIDNDLFELVQIDNFCKSKLSTKQYIVLLENNSSLLINHACQLEDTISQLEDTISQLEDTISQLENNLENNLEDNLEDNTSHFNHIINNIKQNWWFRFGKLSKLGKLKAILSLFLKKLFNFRH